MHDRFGPAQQLSARLLLLVPPAAVTLTTDERDTLITDLASVYETDLPTSDDHLLNDEVERWARKWKKVDSEHRPSDLPAALRLCDKDFFPNLRHLLKIACTMPVTTAESERANNTLKYMKTVLRNRAGDDRLSSLVLLKIHGTRHLSVNAIANRFCTVRPRRLLRFAYFQGD